ncbi:hypothetical protein [Bacillus horti]|uniref:Uncharacterized protein n=1 Tax=Caldalkalibacillus horti TaxID=77523 RepID=A0ABT9VW47_9BACI|nr:hypothetical protein [Bacillus horti]MDQ0165219.1 hypothetical protein [Bacillus horti]
MGFRKVKQYWKEDKRGSLTAYCFFMALLSFTPFFALIMYFGYSDGIIYQDQIPAFVRYIIFPLSFPLVIIFGVLAFTGLYAQIYNKKLSKHSLIVGIFIFLIMISTIIIPRMLS